MSKRGLAHIACISTMIIWGLSFVSIDYCLTVIRPMSLAFIRFFIASIVMFFICKYTRKLEKLRKKDIVGMAFSGVIGISVYFYFENNGILFTDANIASLLLATIPIFTLFSDVLFFKEKLSGRKWGGVLISMMGVALIIGFNFQGGSSIKGNIYMLFAVLAWVIYSVLTKPLTKRYNNLSIVFYQSIFGAATLFPFALFDRNDYGSVDVSIILNVIYLAIFCSIVGYIMYVFSVDTLGITISSFYINFMPLVTVVGSFFILNKTIGLRVIIGGILVILSVFVISEKEKPKKDVEFKEEVVY